MSEGKISDLERYMDAKQINNPQRAWIRAVLEIVRRLSKEKGLTFETDILLEAKAKGIDTQACLGALRILLQSNSIYSKGGWGTYAPLS